MALKRKGKAIDVATWMPFKNNGEFKKYERLRKIMGAFPGGAVVENLPANAGDTGSSPGLGRSHMPRSN